MHSLLRYALLLALVLWIGGIVFFSFIASPSIFKILPREQAGQVVGDIFPKYHLLGYISCLGAAACLLGLRQLGTVQVDYVMPQRFNSWCGTGRTSPLARIQPLVQEELFDPANPPIRERLLLRWPPR